MSKVRVEPLGDVRIGEGGGFIQGGYALVGGYDVRVDDPELLYLVDMRVIAHQGRLACARLTLHQRPDGPPVRGQELRRVIVDSYVEHSRSALPPEALHRRQPIPGGGSRLTPLTEGESGTVGLRRRGPQVADQLQVVAALYQEAAGLPEWARRPTQYVAEQLSVTRGHAGRLVVQARRADLLGEAMRGRPGEKRPAGEREDDQ